MSEKAEDITVKVKYDPNKYNTIDVKISPNAKVYYFKDAIEDELKKNSINNIPVRLLKFNGQELDDTKKTLGELGIKDGSSVENESRVVFIKTLAGETIYITCDENTTVRESLKQLKGKNPEFSYIRLVFLGKRLQRSKLNQKLLGCQIGSRSIEYGDTFHLITALETSKNDAKGEVFDLNNLEESKNSDLVKVSTTSEFDNNPRISLNSKKESKDSNYPLFRIIVGIADLLLLAAAVATFLLYFLTMSLSVAIPIVLTALFVVGAILFFGWDKILPKFLSDSCLKTSYLETNLDEEYKNKIKEIESSKKNNPELEEKKDEKEGNKDD